MVDKANDCHELWVGKPDGFYATGGIDTRLAVTQERVHLYQYRRKISDFSIMATLRHDFYWLDVLTFKDHIRFTPQISFTSGTQNLALTNPLIPMLLLSGITPMCCTAPRMFTWMMS